MKRASEVPPEVESSGVVPVSAATAPTTRSVKGPGSVRKLSPEISKRAAMPTPKAAAARSASSSIQSLSERPVWASLKRMLTVARASAGMTFEAGLPTSIVVIARVEGPKWSVPVSSWREARRSSRRTSAGSGFFARSG